MNNLLAIIGVLIAFNAIGADPTGYDPNEIRLNFNKSEYSEYQQVLLRNNSAWADWNSYVWMAMMSPKTGLPRAWELVWKLKEKI